jgi:hypothetical protein
MSVNPNWSADCHASGAVAYVATVVRGDLMLKLCGHCLVKRTHTGITHLDALVEQGWDIHPLKRVMAGQGVGTESTPPHHALGGF